MAAREATPSAVMVDSQSVKMTEAGGLNDFDASNKVKDRKRHLAVDTLAWPIECQIPQPTSAGRCVPLSRGTGCFIRAYPVNPAPPLLQVVDFHHDR